jgi:hypothetical protein
MLHTLSVLANMPHEAHELKVNPWSTTNLTPNQSSKLETSHASLSGSS